MRHTTMYIIIPTLYKASDASDFHVRSTSLHPIYMLQLHFYFN